MMLLTVLLAALSWLNLDDAHKLGHRKLSEGYMRGKTVLVCRDPKLAERMEDIWGSYKTKPFVLLGAFAEKPEGVTYPIYSEAGIANPPERGALYVVDETGHIYYHGDEDRNAIQALVTALGDVESPRNVTQFRKYLDWEIAETPGAAFNRFLMMKKRFPALVPEYAAKERELKAIKDVKRLAELVDFAKRSKDMRAFDPKKAKTQIRQFKSKMENALSKYKSLVNAEDPRVVQEAKNSLADIKLTLAGLEQ